MSDGDPLDKDLLHMEVKGGPESGSREMAETMLARIQSVERTELILIGALMASLAFGIENMADQDWLIRKVSEMDDILQQHPWW